MSRDTLDVLHQRDGVLEDVVVDPLQNIARWRPALVEVGAIGIVDVPTAIRLGTQKLPVDLKMPCYGTDIVFQVHIKMFANPACCRRPTGNNRPASIPTPLLR